MVDTPPRRDMPPESEKWARWMENNVKDLLNKTAGSQGELRRLAKQAVVHGGEIQRGRDRDDKNGEKLFDFESDYDKWKEDFYGVDPTLAPSKPILSSKLGAVVAHWDGEMQDGVKPPTRLKHVVAEYAITEPPGSDPAAGEPGYEPIADETEWIPVSQPLLTKGDTVITEIPVGDDVWVRFRAYNNVGNVSGASRWAHVVVKGIDTDALEDEIEQELQKHEDYIDEITSVTPTGAPTAPILSTRLGVIIAEWDGMLQGAEGPVQPPIRFQSVVAEHRASGTTDPWVRDSTPILVAGTTAITGGTVGTEYEVRFVSVNMQKFESAAGSSASIVLEGIDGAEISKQVTDAITSAQQTADDAIQDASEAQTTADGKNKVYRGNGAPVGTHENGDLWFDTDGAGNVVGIKVWNGSSWADNQIVADSILVPSSIGATSISDGAVTTPKILARSITGEKIKTRTITSDEIRANTITSNEINTGSIRSAILVSDVIKSNHIETGAITADKVQAGAITANKLTITPNNLLDNPNCTESGWSNGQGSLVGWDLQSAAETGYFNTTAASGTPARGIRLRANGTYQGAWNDARFSVRAGEKLHAEWDAYNALGGGRYQLRIVWGNEEGGAPSPYSSSVGGNNWQVVNRTVTVPQGATNARAVWRLTGQSSGEVRLRNFRVARQADSNLIVGGAVTADKIATDAVIARTIKGREITSGHIKSGTITSNEINTGSIRSAILISDVIKASHIAADAVRASEIESESIYSRHIVSHAITADKIAAESINANKIAAGAINGMTITGATVRSGWGGNRTQMDSNAFRQYRNGTEVLRVSSGFPSGVAVRQGGSGLVDIGDVIFGPEIRRTTGSNLKVYAQRGPGHWNDWYYFAAGTAGWKAPTDRVMINCYFYFEGMANWIVESRVRFNLSRNNNADGSGARTTPMKPPDVLATGSMAQSSNCSLTDVVNVTAGKTYYPFWGVRVRPLNTVGGSGAAGIEMIDRIAIMTPV